MRFGFTALSTSETLVNFNAVRKVKAGALALVPEGHLMIAQRFNAGLRTKHRVSPGGTAEGGGWFYSVDFGRPFGT